MVDIWYSHEDEGFIAIDMSRPGCSAFGKTRKQAEKEIKDAQTAWDNSMKEMSSMLDFKK